MSLVVLARFSGEKSTYIRVHIIMALSGAVLISGALALAGNPDWWVGIVGSFAGIAMRGFYIASEQLGFEWVLTKTGLVSPNERTIGLDEIKSVRSLFGSVQVITRAGDKFLIKYQATPEIVIAEIERAIANYEAPS
ncbi:MAG: hypothetical protein L3J37_03940 [Rhodobacteraceae bacterium]|nr:hypothetical protein [Paracoccaceae bacterium]